MAAHNHQSNSVDKPSTWYQSLLLRDVINRALKETEPWKIVLGSLASVGIIVGAQKLKELSESPRGLLDALASSAIQIARKVPGTDALIKAQSSKILSDLEHSMTINDAGAVSLSLPEAPLTHEEIIALLNRLAERESHKWRDGKVSGMVYLGNDEHTELVNRAFTLYSLTNPLHADVFPSLRKFESEIIAMTINMLGGSLAAGHCGAVTSGGTESILMALKSYRDRARVERPDVVAPEVIACETAHAAFNKGCAYFGLRLIRIKVGADHRMDIAATARAINRNTICLVGSAPCFSSGMIDPIPELGALAQQHNIGLHVDGCLGGFILPFIKTVNPHVPPFDLSVPGVTSMSADTHKYGYTVKGTSVLMFSSRELRNYMYFVDTEWPGGIYASPGMAGSRSGGLIAATWASMMAMGRSKYQEVGTGIWNTVLALKAGIVTIPTLKLLGNTQSSVVAFYSDDLNVFRVGEGMTSRGWALNSLQKPNAIHLCVCAPHIGKHELFLKDLREIVTEVLSSADAHAGGTAGVYGLATSLPDRSIVAEITTGFLDILTKPMAPIDSNQPASSGH